MSELTGRDGTTAVSALRRGLEGVDTKYVLDKAAPLLALVGAAVLWELAVIVFNVPPYILPRPTTLVVKIIEDWPRLTTHIGATAYASAMGLVSGGIAAILLATLMTFVRPLTKLLMPLLVIDQSIPKLALAPLFIIWFGVGLLSKVLISALISFFPILVATLQGLNAIDPRLRDLTKLLSATRWQVFVNIEAPNALRYVFSSLRVAVPLSVIGAVVGEFVQASRGLGYWILISNSRVDTAGVFSGVILLAAISLTYFGLVVGAERFALGRRFANY